jgi:hypothetical protein
MWQSYNNSPTQNKTTGTMSRKETCRFLIQTWVFYSSNGYPWKKIAFIVKQYQFYFLPRITTYEEVQIKSLCLTKHHSMKTYWGSEGITPQILNLGTIWRWMVSFIPRPLYSGERSPGTHWIRGCVGPRAGLDAEEKRKIPSPRRESNSHLPARSQSLYRLSYPNKTTFSCKTQISFSSYIL